VLLPRVIPSLLVRSGGLVKTTKFTKPKYVGDPINAIRIFNDKEVDELIVLDIDASKMGSAPNFELIREFASECFMPLCYGGGIRTLDHAKELFSIGVEKISLQTAALKDLRIVSEIANYAGSSSVVVSIDVKKNWRGREDVQSFCSIKLENNNVLDLLRSAVDAGAGEILLNCVDNDGLMCGMNLELIRKMASEVDIPVVAAGGAGSMSDIRAAIDAGASAVAVGAMFVFHGPHRAVLITYPNRTEFEMMMM